MKSISKEDRILSLESQLNSLIRQMAEFERRLSILERFYRSSVVQPRPNPPAESHEPSVNHNYLKRTISAARREYERAHR